jgi:hypothetical protein
MGVIIMEFHLWLKALKGIVVAFGKKTFQYVTCFWGLLNGIKGTCFIDYSNYSGM